MFKNKDVIDRLIEIKKAKRLKVSVETIREEVGWFSQELKDDPDVERAVNNVLFRCLQSKEKKV